MKSIKNIALAVILITGLLISGCGKNETKNSVTERDVTKQDSQKKMTETIADNQKTEKTDDMKDANQDTKDKKDGTKENKNVEHTMIKIPSAQCEICESNITKALNKVKGIENFKIDIDGKIIHVNYDKNTTTISKIETAITSAGYDANNKTADPVAYSKLDNCCKKPEDRKKNN
jgi:copper chaperone CopZ